MLRSNPPTKLSLVRYASNKGSITTHKETSKIIARRITKAERDERMDLTMALTPVRNYMGGFTRPTDIRASNWFSGGAYVQDKRSFEQPSPFAYEPHTVLLLESRHEIRYGIGFTDHPAHIVTVCRTADLEAVLKKFNSREAGSTVLQLMDNAYWPWVPQKKRNIKWWTDEQDRQNTLQDLQDGDPAAALGEQVLQDTLQQTSRESDEEEIRTKKELRRHLAQTAAVAERVSEEQHLSNIEMEIKPLQAKIPFELEFDDGTVAHPSGFVPPTPADRQYDPEYHLSPHPHSKVATELRRRQMETVNEHHSDSLVPRIEQWKALKERKDEEAGLMSNLTSGILAGGVSAATEPREAKIPTEIHGVHDNAVAQPMQHASGFVPPTARMSRGETDARTSVVRGQNSDSGDAPEAPERPPTFASGDTNHNHTGKQVDPKSPYVSEKVRAAEIATLRKKYLEHIKDEPFWRPLVTLTCSTRPIAKTLARLSRGLSQGKPFYAVIEPEGRKHKLSFASRLRSLRLTRMRTLGVEMAQLFAGVRGGPIGVRFDEHSRGRGIGGEGLEKPIPWEKRVIGVGLGEWYPLTPEFMDSFHVLAKTIPPVVEATGKDKGKSKPPLLIYTVDDYGRPTGDVPELPWPAMEREITPEIQRGLSARLVLKYMEKMLEIKPPVDKELSLYTSSPIPPSKIASSNLIGNHRVPITARFVLVNEPPFSPASGIHEVRNTWARNALYQRIESFCSEYANEIAIGASIRTSGVIYPSQASISPENEIDSLITFTEGGGEYMDATENFEEDDDEDAEGSQSSAPHTTL